VGQSQVAVHKMGCKHEGQGQGPAPCY
jgi:hypothetical protein